MTSPGIRDAVNRKQHWDDIYAAKASNEVSWYQLVPAISLSLIQASGAGANTKIIDVGGGASTLIDHLLAEGFRHLTVLDLSPIALERSRQRLGLAAGQVEWLVADILNWQPEARYDLWHDRAVFHFLTDPEDRRTYLAALSKAIQPGGTLILGTFALDGPERCSRLPIHRYSPETLAAEVGPAFTFVQTEAENHVTPSGAVQRFVYCRFTRDPLV